LFARGFRNGKEAAADLVETTGEPAVVLLSPDRASINADGEDVSVITVKVADSRGRTVPTALNEITFAIQGPGRIIGVGNGDPSSHEPDRFFERVSQVKIEGLKAKAVRVKTDYSETGFGYDDSKWQPALDRQGSYNVKTEDTLKTVVIRGTFRLPAVLEGTEASLWPKSLGQEQAVYVNGRLVANHIRRNDPVRKVMLDRAILREGDNAYAVLGSPLVARYQYDNLNTDPGIVQILRPAAAWKRNAFNGLAQVIVQSLTKSGEVTFTAESKGLTRGTVKIKAQSCVPRPAVPAEAFQDR
jgi:beta-galactosidase